MTDPEFAEVRSGPRTSAADLRVMVKGGAVQFAGFGVNRLANLVFVAITVRFLGPAGYGLYRQVAQLLQMIGNMGPGGFDVAGLRWIAKARASNDPGGVRGAARVAFTGGALVSLSLGLLVFLTAAWIARGFADSPADVEPMVELIRLGAAFVPLYALMQVVRFTCQGFKTNIPSVVAGNVGGGGRLEFTVIGHTVNIAARVESATRETDDAVLLSESTRDLLADPPDLTPREGMRLKGYADEVTLYAPPC